MISGDRSKGGSRRLKLATLLKVRIAQTKQVLLRYQEQIPWLMVILIIAVTLVSYQYQSENIKLVAPPMGDFSGQDFLQVLRASREVLQGENIYQHALTYAKNPSFAEFIWWNAAPYPYPPVPAILTMPLTKLEDGPAVKLWTGINWLLLICSGIIAVYAFTNAGSSGRIQRLILIIALILVYGPNHLALRFGQLDISILFLLMLTFWLYRRGYQLAGVPFGLAIALKPIIVPVLVYFLWKRQWRPAFVAVITTALLVIMSFFVVGWQRLPDYLEVNRLWATSPMLAYPFNQSVNGFVIRLFTTNVYIEPLYVIPWLTYVIRFITILLSIVVWLVLVSRDDNREQLVGGVEYAITLTTMLLFAPLVDDVHFVWVLMPISALLLTLLADIKEGKKLLLLVASFAVTLYLAHPDLHDAVYRGAESLYWDNILVDRSYVWLTGAYLFGLIGLHICLVVFLMMDGKMKYFSRFQTQLAGVTGKK